MITAEELKRQVKTKANENNLHPQDIMQMYFFERLLYRISVSRYKRNFILKGGLLLSAILGDIRRTTQDMDMMIREIELSFQTIKKIIEEIVTVELDDGIKYKVTKYKDIRQEDKYGGIKVYLLAYKEHLQVPLSIDISINDPITPKELEFEYKCIFDEGYISVMTYNIETIIAEKFQTLIEDNVGNTRSKDFYDLYMLISEYYKNIDKEVLVEAIRKTFKRRDFDYDVSRIRTTYKVIRDSEELKDNFINRFQQKNIYAKDVLYKDVMDEIKILVDLLDY